MKLATLKNGTPDGALLIVSSSLNHAIAAAQITPTLQSALDRWNEVFSHLRNVYRQLNNLSDASSSETLKNMTGEAPFALSIDRLEAPLPRAFQWADASAYLSHVRLVRKARGADMPPDAETNPLMYQGASDCFMAPSEPICMASEEWGIDFEAEVAVITSEISAGADEQTCADAIRLVTLVNDVSLRNLIPGELAKGFGFVQSKPATTMAPVVVTPDELGSAWNGRRLARELHVRRSGKKFGRPNAGVDLTFDFPMLLKHAAKTRKLGCGTIMGSGTVSNDDQTKGACCIAEIRMIETIEQGAPKTEFMKFGERVQIEMFDDAGQSIFGPIDQVVAPLSANQ